MAISDYMKMQAYVVNVFTECHLICLVIRDWKSWSTRPHKRLFFFFCFSSRNLMLKCSVSWSSFQIRESVSPGTNGNADNYTYILGTMKYIRGASQKFPDFPGGARTGSTSHVRRYTPNYLIYCELMW